MLAITLSAYPQKDLGDTILSNIDSQVSLSLLPKTDNNTMNNRLVQCQSREQSFTAAPARALTQGRCLLWKRSLLLGHATSQATVMCCCSTSQLETVSPISLQCSWIPLPKSPFFLCTDGNCIKHRQWLSPLRTMKTPKWQVIMQAQKQQKQSTEENNVYENPLSLLIQA